MGKNGDFWWPPKSLKKASFEKLIKDADSVPDFSTWEQFKCKVKRAYHTYEEADAEANEMRGKCCFYSKFY